jgi:hypothetical protein
MSDDLLNTRYAARDALIDLWAREGFKVPDPPEQDLPPALGSCGAAGRDAILSGHEAEWRIRKGR